MDNIILKLENEPLHKGTHINWTWKKGEKWVILGENGSGKTRFLELLEEKAGKEARSVSFENLERILEEQIHQDDSEFLGRIDTGTPLYRFLGLESNNISALPFKTGEGYEELLNQGIRTLSTGEMRRALIYRAVLAEPTLLMLDEPFDGLDVEAAADMKELIASLIREGHAVLMILNRKSEILEEHTHIGVFRDHQLAFTGSREEWIRYEKENPDRINNRLPIPDPPSDSVRYEGSASLVIMEDVTVRYGDKTILNNLFWEVKQGEHWQISGPNGAGKTTLLNLISGDNPQAYSNKVSLFGNRRGSGETVWEIKEKVGIISPALQLNYRVSLTARMCIVSGLFDSIGVYDKVSPLQRALADRWLAYLGMSDRADRPIKRLSYGEQRLLLIARGLIKHPPLLILDEPCQGLDDRNRLKVLKLLEEFASQSNSTLLYVTHHREDRIEGINRHLRFIPAELGYTCREEPLTEPNRQSG